MSSAARPRILVVDDNPVNLMIAAEMLALCGTETLQAGDGAEAVALACELRLDLILMDIQMPVLDGLSATVQIRQWEQQNGQPRVPVVAYTSSGLPHGRLFLRSVGIDDVLEKPGDMASFQACIARWCTPDATPSANDGLGRRQRHPAAPPRNAA